MLNVSTGEKEIKVHKKYELVYISLTHRLNNEFLIWCLVYIMFTC